MLSLNSGFIQNVELGCYKHEKLLLLEWGELIFIESAGTEEGKLGLAGDGKSFWHHYYSLPGQLTRN